MYTQLDVLYLALAWYQLLSVTGCDRAQLQHKVTKNEVIRDLY